MSRNTASGTVASCAEDGFLTVSRKLFVGGCPRSGTTIMARLLNLHEQVALGEERYGLRFVDGFPPNAFDYQRFFDFRDGDAAFDREHESYGVLQSREPRFCQAKYVGDKIPKIYEHMDRTTEMFPGATFILMVRNLYDVACSYEARAADVTDTSWPQDFDSGVAVSEWNDCLYAIKEWQRPGLVVVPFEDLFLAGQGLEENFSALGLDVTDKIEQAFRALVDVCRDLDVNRRRFLGAEKTQKLLRTGHFVDYDTVLRLA